LSLPKLLERDGHASVDDASASNSFMAARRRRRVDQERAIVHACMDGRDLACAPFTVSLFVPVQVQ
jgi:hypothetical protein